MSLPTRNGYYFLCHHTDEWIIVLVSGSIFTITGSNLRYKIDQTHPAQWGPEISIPILNKLTICCIFSIKEGEISGWYTNMSDCLENCQKYNKGHTLPIYDCAKINPYNNGIFLPVTNIKYYQRIKD